MEVSRSEFVCPKNGLKQIVERNFRSSPSSLRRKRRMQAPDEAGGDVLYDGAKTFGAFFGQSVLQIGFSGTEPDESVRINAGRRSVLRL